MAIYFPPSDDSGIGFQGLPLAERKARTAALRAALETASTREEWIFAYMQIAGLGRTDAEAAYEYTQREAQETSRRRDK